MARSHPSSTTTIIISLLPHLTDAGVDWAVRVTSSSGEMSIFAFFFFVFFQNNFYPVSFSLWPFFLLKAITPSVHIGGQQPSHFFLTATFCFYEFHLLWYSLPGHFSFCCFFISHNPGGVHFAFKQISHLIFLCLLLLHFCFLLLSSLSFSILFFSSLTADPLRIQSTKGPAPKFPFFKKCSLYF